MESAKGADHVLAGPEVEVIGVAQHHLRAGAFDFHRMEAADGAVGADGHERRRRHLAVRRVQRAGASLALGGVEGEGEGRVGHRMHIASP